MQPAGGPSQPRVAEHQMALDRDGNSLTFCMIFFSTLDFTIGHIHVENRLFSTGHFQFFAFGRCPTEVTKDFGPPSNQRVLESSLNHVESLVFAGQVCTCVLCIILSPNVLLVKLHFLISTTVRKKVPIWLKSLQSIRCKSPTSPASVHLPSASLW